MTNALVGDYIIFEICGLPVLAEIYAVNEKSLDANVIVKDTELICSYFPKDKQLHCEVTVDEQYNDTQKETFENVSFVFTSDNLTSSERKRYVSNAAFVMRSIVTRATAKKILNEEAMAPKVAMNSNDSFVGPASSSDANYMTEQSKIYYEEAGPSVRSPTVRRTEIDGEIYLVQTAPKNNPKIHFGPLSIQLSDLMLEGFDLTVLGYRSNRKSERRATLYLTRKGEQYKICRKFMNEFLESDDLSGFVKEQNLTHKLNLNVEYKELPFTPVVAEERDPYDTLLERYPYVATPKDDIMYGNRTLHEVISDAIGGSMEKLSA